MFGHQRMLLTILVNRWIRLDMDLSVSQDRDKGVVTLTGTVPTSGARPVWRSFGAPGW